MKKTRTRGNGLGTVYRDGKYWRAQVNRYEFGERFSKSKSGFLTKTDALRWCALNANFADAGVCPTFERVFYEWSAAHYPTISEKKRQQYNHVFECSGRISKRKFNELTVDLVERTLKPVRQAMQDAGLKPSDLHKVLLVGGSTRIPAVQEAVKGITGTDGFKGIKLHPEFQNIYADSDEMTTVCRRAAKYGMTVVFHAGRDIGYPPPVKTEPDMLLRLLDRVPDLKLVAAHLGGWMMWDEVAAKLCGSPIYFDTAFISDFIEPSLARDIINAHGADKVLFGSDAPWEDPAKTLDFLRSLSIDPEDLKKICGTNAAGLLGIKNE